MAAQSADGGGGEAGAGCRCRARSGGAARPAWWSALPKASMSPPVATTNSTGPPGLPTEGTTSADADTRPELRPAVVVHNPRIRHEDHDLRLDCPYSSRSSPFVLLNGLGVGSAAGWSASQYRPPRHGPMPGVPDQPEYAATGRPGRPPHRSAEVPRRARACLLSGPTRRR